MSQIPEEIEAMAFLIGQSNQIDAMMMEKPSTLITSTATLRQGLNEYVQQQRREHAPPPVQYPQVAQPPFVPIPNYVPPQELPQVPIYAPTPLPKVDDGQLEFNLDPSKTDIIINLLKEISVKLTKQNTLLEKYATECQKRRISETPIKLIPNK